MQRINPLYLATLFLFTFALNFRRIFNFDEGLILSYAHNVTIGGKIYTDFHTFISPGTFILNALFFKFFSSTYYSALIPSIFIIYLSSLFITKLTEAVSAKLKYVSLSAFFWVLLLSCVYPPISYHTYSISIDIIAIYFFIDYLKANNNKILFISALLFGINILFYQPSFVVALPMIFYLFDQFKKGLLSLNKLLISFSLLIFPFSTILLFADPIALIKDLIYWPISQDISYSQLNWPQYLLVCLLPISLFIVCSKKYFSKQTNFLIIFQIVLLLTTVTRRDINHILLNSFTFPLSITLLVNLFFKAKTISNGIKFAVVWFALVCFSIVALNKLTINYEQSKNYDNIKGFVEQFDEKSFYAHPFLPNLYFELNSRDIYPYSFILNQSHDSARLSENLNALRKLKPEVVFQDHETINHLNYGPNNAIDNYINDNYSFFRKYGNIKVYIRNY